MKKKMIITLASLLIIMILVLLLIMKQPNLKVLVNNKEINDVYKMTLEYNRDLKINPELLNLKVLYDDEDITNKLTYKDTTISELKTYDLDFKYENEVVLSTKIKIVDNTAPIITGVKDYSVYQNDKFDVSSLKLEVSDNYDNNLKDKISMPSVNTKEVGKRTIDVVVSDSSNNKTTYKINLDVQAKPVVALPGKPLDSIIVTNPNDITVLVNKSNYLPNGWAPNDLVQTKSGYVLRKQAADAWENLYANARKDYIDIRIVSAYRTQAYQNNLYNNYYASDPTGAPFYSAKARTSEHELGLAIDISYDSQLHNDLHKSSVGKWMDANAHKYGYIMRYPSNKTNITNYMHEPWHYRYVGIELATHLKANNIALEEYYRKA